MMKTVNRNRYGKINSLFLCFLLFLSLMGCGLETNDITPDEQAPEESTIALDTQYENLQKLCKVWGFTKYTHKSFLLGLNDWDDELLNLIPLVQSATEEETNEILYDWFIGLGEDGYDEYIADNADKSGLRYMANMEWLSEEYLSEQLAAALSRCHGISDDIDRATAPVFFDHLNNSVHSNENSYGDMDVSDNGYRLLGLFRLWNAIEYYFPYMDIIDDDWNELLLTHIPLMLSETDRHSYEATLISLASKLDDAHVTFSGSYTPFINERYKQAIENNCRPPSPKVSHVLLENNIGLINPSQLYAGEIHDIMQEFADTDGLIVDFRQYPTDFLPYSLGYYLVDERQPFAFMSSPSMIVPGVFADIEPLYSGRSSDNHIEDIFYHEDSYYYDKKVVLIMDETTMSQPEFTIMSLRNGKNVTVMGRNSIGADGNVTTLPLPGGISMWYTGLGVYYPDGGQTQRIGIAPDIYIERTAEDAAEYRDELMAAALEFLLDE